MRFLISLTSTFFLAGVLASLVDFNRLDDKNRLIRPQPEFVGENPLNNLVDASQLKDEAALNRLAERTKGPRTHVVTYGYCPNSVLVFKGLENVKFVLYNKNWSRGVDISKDLGNGKLIPNKPIKFLIHGFLNGDNSMMIQVVKNAYMELGDDINVIAVDWTKGSGSWLSNYYDCLITNKIVLQVGKTVATFIVDLINDQNVNILNVNIIGHSVGAHISGRAGKILIELGYKVPIIVGLDPALPEFQYIPESERLAPTDADYVEVIHTNPGDLGFETPLGVADFYPNWGLAKYNRQPNCFTLACSHAMSFEYFAESIVNPYGFEAYKCESFETLKAGQCMYKERSTKAFMGGSDMRTGKHSGIFKLATNLLPPYGKKLN